MPVCDSSKLKTEILMCPAPASAQAPLSLPLEDNGVHVWCASLKQTAAELEHLHRVLSREEIERANRFHFARDRNHFIAARGLLRTTLGRYLEADSAELRFCYSPNGKPDLAPEFALGDLRFNLSHSGEIVLFAITRGRRIGVDVEKIRTDFETEHVAERFFSLAESSRLRALPAEQKHEAFFACWTRKEAYVKATGDGLSLPLDQFDVSVAPGEPAVLQNTRPDPAEARRWYLQALKVEPGYAAALAVERPSCS